METFKSAGEYITALRKEPAIYAIIPKSLGGEALELSTAGITKRIEQGKLTEVEIGERRYLLASGVTNSFNNERKRTERIRKILEDCARKKQTINYGELMERVGMSSKSPPDRDKIGTILGAISKATYDKNGIMLSVLVVRKHDSLPSQPFFDLARELEFRFTSDSRFAEEHTELVCSEY